MYSNNIKLFYHTIIIISELEKESYLNQSYPTSGEQTVEQNTDDPFKCFFYGHVFADLNVLINHMI